VEVVTADGQAIRASAQENADLIVSQWQDRSDPGVNIAWAKETFEQLRPYLARRRYLNNLPADDGRVARDLWGVNYERLVSVKRRYDPDNAFRLNHNINPGAGSENSGRPVLG